MAKYFENTKGYISSEQCPSHVNQITLFDSARRCIDWYVNNSR